MFWGLNKTRCPGFLSLAHMLYAAFSHSSSSYLTRQMEARTGQTPSSACLEVHRLLYQLPLTWSGSQLPVCVPISLSSCLLSCTSLALCLADLFLITPSNPTILPHFSDTGAHTQANTNVGLFHSLFCTSSSGSTASTCINAPQQCI